MPEDLLAVEETLRHDDAVLGATTAEYEKFFAACVHAKHAIALSSSVAAMHAAVAAIGLKQGEEVITTPIGPGAAANCVRYCGGDVQFADIDPETMAIDPESVAASVSPNTRAIIAVDYAGCPADIAPLRTLADTHKAIFIEDATHGLGAEYMGRRVGALAQMTVFGTQAGQIVSTGEGGVITTDNDQLALWLRTFRNEGLRTDPAMRSQRGDWFHSMDFLGYGYRPVDVQSALGLSQLRRLDQILARRRRIAGHYATALAELPELDLPLSREDREPAWEFFWVRLITGQLEAGRGQIFRALRAEGIQVNVLYIPIYWHPYYERLGYRKGLCPAAEMQYERVIALPLWHGMSDADVNDVVEAFHKVITTYRR